MAVVKANGNMYPWVTHCHSHLRGACSHECPYCYVQAIGRRFGSAAHTGPLRLKEEELRVKYGEGRTYFIEHSNDLFQEAVASVWIALILDHCRRWPDNFFVLQSRNTERAEEWYAQWPRRCMMGTTIETNRGGVGKAPSPMSRAKGLRRCKQIKPVLTTFVTIEPILDFDVDELLGLLDIAHPDFVNIGADSKGHGVVEPCAEKVLALIEGIKGRGVEIRQKTNFGRILK